MNPPQMKLKDPMRIKSINKSINTNHNPSSLREVLETYVQDYRAGKVSSPTTGLLRTSFNEVDLRGVRLNYSTG